MKTKLTDAEKKAKKAEADKRYREKKKAEQAASKAPVAKKAAKAPTAEKAPAKKAAATKAEKDMEKDVTMVLKKDLRIFFSKKLDPAQSQVLKAGKEITLEETGRTVNNEAGKPVKLFRFRRGAKRVYYAVEPK
jgi:hypothetical protein